MTIDTIQKLWIELWHVLPFHQILVEEKRIFWPYLLLCGLYVLLFVLFYGYDKIKFKPKDLVGASARVDYALWICNHAIQAFVLPVSFGNGLLFAVQIDRWLLNSFGLFPIHLEPNIGSLILYAVCMLISMDFARFLLHYALHHVPILIPIHMIHHHAEVLTPITLFRVHPIEMIFSQLRYLLVYSVVTGVFMYIHNDMISMPEIFGASIIVLMSNILAANLRHSPVPISFGFLERIFISPKQHQIHHAKNHAHEVQNLGSMFAFWDIIWGTWRPSSKSEVQGFGVHYKPSQTLWSEFLFPFRVWKNFLGWNKK